MYFWLLMSFASPFILYGLFALLAPIIIHLFDLQKPKKVFFSNVNILKSVNQQTVATRKLKNLMVLLMRLLFILFLVLAFAQPFISTGIEKNTLKSISVFVDNSLSMNSSNGSSTMLNESLVQLEKLALSLNNNTKYFFLDNNFQSKDNYPLSKDRFKDRLTETKPTTNTRTLEEIYKKIKLTTNQQTENQNNTIVIFSDFQKSTIGKINDIAFDSTQKIILVPMQNSDISTIFIDTIWVENLFNTENGKNTLHLIVRNSGKKKLQPNIKLFVDDAQNANTSLTIEANQQKEIVFDLITKDRKAKKCKLKIDNDAITFDNEYFFMINASPVIEILSLDNGSNTYINSVYQSETIFHFKENKLGSLSARDLSKSNLCIIHGFDRLNLSEQNQLVEFTEKGGCLVLFPSTQVSQPSLDNMLKRFKLENNTLILNALSAENKSNVVFPDTKNPFFEGIFEKIDKSTTMPYAFPIFKNDSKSNSLFVTSKDNAFLTKRKLEKGIIYLFSVPIDNQYTDFFNHSLFVPTMYKIAFSSNNSSQQMAYSSSEKTIKLPFVLSNNEQKLKLEKDNFSYIPEQILRSDGLIFKMPAISFEPGFYNVKIADSVLSTIAINPSKAESLLDYYSTEQLQKVFEKLPNIQVLSVKNDLEVVETIKNQNQGISLWKYCVVLALLSLLAETLLIRFWK